MLPFLYPKYGNIFQLARVFSENFSQHLLKFIRPPETFIDDNVRHKMTNSTHLGNYCAYAYTRLPTISYQLTSNVNCSFIKHFHITLNTSQSLHSRILIYYFMTFGKKRVVGRSHPYDAKNANSVK